MQTRCHGFVAAILLLVVTRLCSVAAASVTSSCDTLQPHNNFLIGIANVGWQHEGNRSACGKELEVLIKAVDERARWILKVLDSFGQAPASFGWGNYHWFGAQHLCEELNTPYRISLQRRQTSEFWFNISSPMPLRFVMLYANFTTPYYINLSFLFEHLLHIGLCLPRSCDLASVRHYALTYFQSGEFRTQRDFDVKIPEIIEVRVPHFNGTYFKQGGSMIFIAIVLLLIMAGVAAEILHILRAKAMLHKTNTIKTMPATNGRKDVSELKPNSKWARFIDCFRLEENVQRALKVEPPQQRGVFLSVIAGARTIVCLWVTVFHVYFFSLSAMTNSTMVFAKLEAFLFQPVVQACYYVDTFFVISAFLLVYHFLAHEKQMQEIRENGWRENCRLYARMAARRYMRLTPVMVVTLLLSDRFFDLLNMWSPFRLDEHSGVYNKSNWWANLLYLHNFFDMRDISCSWMWYIACEMQYCLLFTLLLFVYAKNERLGRIAYVTLAVLAVIVGWLCYFQQRLTFQFDAIQSTLDTLYIKPWMRINPYVGGAAFGWLLHRAQRGKSQAPARQQPVQPPASMPAAADEWNVGRAAFWSLCALVYAYTNFMSYWRETPAWLVATIMSAGRLIFAGCVGGIIYECAHGRGGYVQRLLGHRIFLFFNKFCYSMYMLAPLVIVVVYALRGTATTFTEVSSGIEFLGIMLLSVVSAVLMFILIELPFQRAVDVLLPSRREKCAQVRI